VMGFRPKKKGAQSGHRSRWWISPKPAGRELALGQWRGLAGEVELSALPVTIAERYWLACHGPGHCPGMVVAIPEQASSDRYEAHLLRCSRPPAPLRIWPVRRSRDLVVSGIRRMAGALINRTVSRHGQRQNPFFCPQETPQPEQTSCAWVPVQLQGRTQHLMGGFALAIGAGPPRQGFFGVTILPLAAAVM